MHVDDTKEEMILYENKDKDDDVIYEQDVDCSGVRQPRRDSRPV